MRRHPESRLATLSCVQGSRSVLSSGLVRPDRVFIYVTQTLNTLLGLMSNIVDGIQRPLRVSSLIRLYGAVFMALHSPSKNFRNLSIFLVVLTPRRWTARCNGISTH